jgi:hypothetical protein
MNKYCSRFKFYAYLANHWFNMLRGKSYWHAPQGLGRKFVPGELLGYYNDITQKIEWNGLVDAKGIPMQKKHTGEIYYFPTTVFQKALGHWDVWLESKQKDTEQHTKFLNIAQWALEAQDDKGGWEILALPYSAMTQGEGASVLIRAFSNTGDKIYLRAAKRALILMLTPLEEGGTSRYVSEGVVLQEYPKGSYDSALNGWIFALYGLYDFTLLENCAEIQQALDNSLNALVAYLPKYNSGFWSFYDLSGNITSPFYHQLHIAQLQALELTFPNYKNYFAQTRLIFEKQKSSLLNRTQALIVKGYQKLYNPPTTVIH